MRENVSETVIVVHPVNGMQLSEGYIRSDKMRGFYGALPGLMPSVGASMEEVRNRLEREARNFYGSDVVVEVAMELVTG
jgi:hypothetical protein